MRQLTNGFRVFLVLGLATLTFCDRIVETSSGRIRSITVSSGEPTIEAFLGVPYAEPPIGQLRFQRPVPKQSWSEVLNASSLPVSCTQNSNSPQNMSEDCLYLNLWVPYSNQSDFLKPVIVYIHGGALERGSSNKPIYDGTKLSQLGDVLFANFNYRLGVMGFFSAFIPEANGNMGMYDQVMAIRWIKNNVRHFGGDPDNLVLMGQSAGSWSVSMHLTSPMMKGVFKRVIMESGANKADLPDVNADLLIKSQTLAAMLNCTGNNETLVTNPRNIVNCLKQLPADKLKNAERAITGNITGSFFPRIGDEFLPESTIESLKKGDFHDGEMLIGVNKDEGNFILCLEYSDIFSKDGHNSLEPINRTFSKNLIRSIFKDVLSNTKSTAEFYVNRVHYPSSNNFKRTIGDSVGDYWFTCGATFMAEFYSERNPVYFYKFTRRQQNTKYAKWVGVTHLSELPFVFGNNLYGKLTKIEEFLRKEMMLRWIAFAKTGNPNIHGKTEWPLHTRDNPIYLKLDIEESHGVRADEGRCEVWRSLYMS